MERLRLGLAKFVGFVAVLALIGTNAAWYVSYHSLETKLAASNAKAEALDTKTAGKPTPAPNSAKGVIAGNVGFPTGSAPAQTVCAVSTTDSTAKYCVDHNTGTAPGYQLAVPAGTYTVYASLKASTGDFKMSYKAYYNKYVTCGQQASCASGLHGQNEVVTVAAGGNVAEVDPTDWYAMGITQ